MMFSIPNVVFADSINSEVLKYDVSSFEVKYDKVKINGWARKAATETGDHNYGGKNLRIYVAAVVNDNYFESNVTDIKNHLKSYSTSDSNKNKSKSGKYIIKETRNYTNENLLFPTLCLKDCLVGGNKVCCEKPFNITSGKGVVTDTSTCEFEGDFPKYMSHGGRSTCISYNTGFEVRSCSIWYCL